MKKYSLPGKLYGIGILLLILCAARTACSPQRQRLRADPSQYSPSLGGNAPPRISIEQIASDATFILLCNVETVIDEYGSSRNAAPDIETRVADCKMQRALKGKIQAPLIQVEFRFQKPEEDRLIDRLIDRGRLTKRRAQIQAGRSYLLFLYDYPFWQVPPVRVPRSTNKPLLVCGDGIGEAGFTAFAVGKRYRIAPHPIAGELTKDLVEQWPWVSVDQIVDQVLAIEKSKADHRDAANNGNRPLQQ